jgi:hypothetical protein
MCMYDPERPGRIGPWTHCRSNEGDRLALTFSLHTRPEADRGAQKRSAAPGAMLGLALNEGPVSRRIRRVSAVSLLSKPLERSGLWTGPDGRSDCSEIDRGAQERGGIDLGIFM